VMVSLYSEILGGHTPNDGGEEKKYRLVYIK